MKSWNLHVVANVNQDYKKLAIRTAGLSGVVGAFSSNMNRIERLAQFPSDVIDYATAFSSIVSSVNAVSPGLDEASRKNAVELMFREVMAKFILLRKSEDQDMDARRQVLSVVFDGLPAVVPETAAAIESILASLVTNMWTTFETLACDLWVTAVNLHPQVLSDLGRKGNAKEHRSVPIIRIQKYGYDLRKAMGSLLHAAKKISFARLEEIRSAYERAFSSDGDKLEACLDSTGLDALSAVRNVIVHRGGICDEDYERVYKAKNLRGIAPPANAGMPVELDSDMVQLLISSGCSSCIQLILEVDSWISLHP